MEYENKFKDILKERLVTYNEKYEWTSIHRARKESIFCGQKIVAPYRSKTNSFAYNDIEWFCRSDVYVITSKNEKYSLLLLLGLLNSKLYYCWLSNQGKKKGEILELMQDPLKQIPLPIISDKTKIKIIDNVREIIAKKKCNINTFDKEKEIDRILYSELNLTPDEIKIIEEDYNG